METVLTRIEAYRSFKQALQDQGIEEADREARLIISQAIGKEISDIFLYSSTRLLPSQNRKANVYLKRRISGMPLQYATKTAYFMGLPFYVDQRVLIPRPETELLVENTQKRLTDANKSVLDLCTGSGCIAVSLALFLKNASVTASDKYSGALTVAKRNAAINGVSDRITFVKSDLFNGIEGKYDVIVSNPPYISKKDYAGLDTIIRCFEPKAALIAGDGLIFYRQIAQQAKSYLNKNGEVLLEIGYDQAKSVAKLFQNNGFYDIACIKDYSGCDRIITAKI